MIAVGCDHGGFELKNEILKYLEANNYEYKDFSSKQNNPEDDFPDYAEFVAQSIVSGQCDKGILICGTGIGMSIAANKIPGIRAALCCDCFSARMSREHNDANILTLGERVLGVGHALEIVKTWLSHEFKGDRHKRRIDKITKLEKINKGE
jgi:ribose 5-phosphate isomerase B